MFKYLCDKFEWTDRQTSEINWKAMGLAKRRLTHAESIRISKLMHEWLNVGKQKERIHGSATDALCPCCGTAHEDQDHMFQCQSEPTRDAIKTGLENMEKTFRKDNMPPAVTMAFMNRIRQATAQTHIKQVFGCPWAWNAGEEQDTLGTMAILRGHHHKSWFYAIQESYSKRTSPPGKGKKKVKDKPPLELCVTLIRETWRLFETIWETRNNCLHDPTGAQLAHLDSQLTERLIHYKRKAGELLHHHDRHHINYREQTITSWKHKRKYRLLKILDGWHQKFKAETDASMKNQKSLLDYAGYTIPPSP